MKKAFLSIFVVCLFSVVNLYGAKQVSQQNLASECSFQSDSFTWGGPISFVGGKGPGGPRSPIEISHVSPVNAYFMVYASNEQLLFVNSLDVIQTVPFTIEDESGETVEETSVYIPAAGSGNFNISSLEGDRQYRIIVSINGTYYYGYFYK